VVPSFGFAHTCGVHKACYQRKRCAHSIVLCIPELVHVDCASREGVHIPQCCVHTSKCVGMIVMCIYVCICFEAGEPV
jgi:hypothetical protein